MNSILYLNVVANVAIAVLFLSPMIQKKRYGAAIACLVSFFCLLIIYYNWAFGFTLSECFWKALRQSVLTAAVAIAHSWSVNYEARKTEKRK